MIIDASNCPIRMVFDDASKTLERVIPQVRRAFVRQSKIAYIWRPPQSLSENFREQAIERVYHPMAARKNDWLERRRESVYTPRSYDLTDDLDFQAIAADKNISTSIVEYRLETIDRGFTTTRPFLRATAASIAKGEGNDAQYICMLHDGYGLHKGRSEYPIHFDGATDKLDDYVLRYRRNIDIRAVCVDRLQGTRIYNLTAHEVGGRNSCDNYGFKQKLAAGKPFLLTQPGDILFIETGRRPARQAVLHEASHAPSVCFYDGTPEELRLVRTYDFTLPLNKDDITAQNKIWRLYRDMAFTP